MRSRFIVIGPQGAGKSTFAQHLADALGTNMVDTSEFLVRVETARMKGIHEVTGGLDAAIQWDHERQRPQRRYLVALGDALKLFDPAILGRYCFRAGDVCCGVRSFPELSALKREFQAKVVYVGDRDHTPDPEDNFTLTTSHAQFVISNAGSKDDLKRAAQEMARHHG